MVSPGKLIYYNGNAAYYSHRSRLSALGSWVRTAQARTELVLPPARQVDSDSPRCDGETPKDRTACSVCRFVRNTQKRCTITAGRLTLLGPVPPHQLSFPSSSRLPCLVPIPSARKLAAPQSQSRADKTRLGVAAWPRPRQ